MCIHLSPRRRVGGFVSCMSLTAYLGQGPRQSVNDALAAFAAFPAQCRSPALPTCPGEFDRLASAKHLHLCFKASGQLAKAAKLPNLHHDLGLTLACHAGGGCC